MKNEQGSMDVKQKNGTPVKSQISNLKKFLPPPEISTDKRPQVLQAPLHKHSAESTSASNLPSTLHAGFCNSTNPIAAILTSSFLDFSASQGTDLRKAGVKEGAKYCVDVKSWKAQADKDGQDVPRVILESTHVDALKSVDLQLLKKFAAEQERQAVHGAARPSDGTKGWVRESSEIGGKEPRA